MQMNLETNPRKTMRWNRVNGSSLAVLLLTLSTTVALAATPQLSTFQSPGWSDSLVVTNVQGVRVDSNPIYSTDILFVSVGITNNGTADINTQVNVQLSVDGVAINPQPTFSTPNLTQGAVKTFTDFNIGTLPAGGHSIRVDLTAAAVTSFFYNKSITVRVAPPVIISSLTATGVITNPFTYQIGASNNPTSYNAVGLPGGLAVNTATGLISGNSRFSGTFSVTISASNSGGTGSATLTLTINNIPPKIDSPSSVVGRVGRAFSFIVDASGPVPITFAGTPLPSGLSIIPGPQSNQATITSDAATTKSPTQAGITFVTLVATNAGGTDTQILKIDIQGPPIITSPLIVPAVQNQHFSYQIMASGSPAPTPDVVTGAVSTTSFTSAGLVGRQSLVGATVTMLSGASAGQSRLISTHDVVAGTITVANAFGVAPSVNDQFQIEAFCMSPNPPLPGGVTTAASPTSLTSSDLINGPALINGARITIVSGVDAGGTSTINSFNSGTGAITTTGALGAAPPNPTDLFVIEFVNATYAAPIPSLVSDPFVVDPTTGIIGGTPTVAGSFTFSIVANKPINTNGVACTNNDNVGVGVAYLTVAISAQSGAPAITSSLSASGIATLPFTYGITATNGPSSFSAAGLPAGLSIDPVSGVISGIPVAAGTSNVTVTATNVTGSGSATVKLVFAPAVPIVHRPPPNGIVITTGQPLSFQVVADFMGAGFGPPPGASLPPPQGGNFLPNAPAYPAAPPFPTYFSATINPIPNPANFSINPVTGVISGTPAVAGNFTITITATNKFGTSSPQTLSLTVVSAAGGGAPQLQGPFTIVGTVGCLFKYQITTLQGSPAAAAFNSNPSPLPDNLVLDINKGLISGTPQTAGTFNFTITAGTSFDSAGGIINPTIPAVPYTVIVLATQPVLKMPLLAGPSFAQATVGGEFIYPLFMAPSSQDSTATFPMIFSTPTPLPSGFILSSFNPTQNPLDPPAVKFFGDLDGVIFGTPVNVGTVIPTITSLNAKGSISRPLAISVAPVTISNPNPFFPGARQVTGQVGVPLSFQITATGQPNAFNATGLPPGLSIDTRTGIFSGIPVDTGSATPVTFNATISASNPFSTGSAPLQIIINPAPPNSPVISGILGIGGSPGFAPAPTVAPGTLSATGTAGTPINAKIDATNAPTSYQAIGLPPGLVITQSGASAGQISGSTGQVGSFSITLVATNANGSGAKLLTLTINAVPPSITSALTAQGVVGQLLNYVITASGTQPITFSTSTLPPGLTLSGNTITGNPTSAGGTIITLSASNAAGTDSKQLSLTIVQPPAIPAGLSFTGTVGQPFSQTVSPTGSMPMTFSAAGLPTGLNIDPNSGVISGTPGAVGLQNVQVTATNTGGSDTKTIPIQINPVTITSSLVIQAVVGQQLNYIIVATGNPSSYTATNLPTPLAFSAPNLISGVPAVAGTFMIPVSATNGIGTGTATLTLAVSQVAGSPAITSPLLIGTTVGSTVQYTIAASNNPTSFDALNLPPGLQVSKMSGQISGVPSTAGTFNVTVIAKNGIGQGQANLVVAVSSVPGAPAISSGPIATGMVFSNFSYAITATNNPTSFNASSISPTAAVSGAPAPSTTAFTSAAFLGVNAALFNNIQDVTMISGTLSNQTRRILTVDPAAGTVTLASAFTGAPAAGDFFVVLPDGLTANTATGVISGVPTVATSTSINLLARNQFGSGAGTLTIAISASGAPAITSPLTLNALAGTPLSYQITASPLASSFGASPLPAGLNVDPVAGVISGTPTNAGPSNITLSATNANGTGTALLSLFVSAAPPVIVSPLSVNGAFGQAYASPPLYTVTATGTQPITFSIAGGALPGGMALDPNTGQVTGTPNTSGSFTASVRATNSTGADTKQISFNIYVRPQIVSPSTVTAYVGQGFVYATTASGTQPITFAIGPNSALPAGLSLDPISGNVTGTPTQGGTVVTKLVATNPGGSGPLDVTFNVVAPPVFTSPTVINGIVGVPINYNVKTAGTDTLAFPMTFSTTPSPLSNLISGLQLTDPSPADNQALISGVATTPTLVPSPTFTITASNAAGSASLTVTITIAPVTITSATSLTAVQGAAITPYQITATGNPTTFTLTGAPAGITISPTGLITGSSAAAGTFNATITASNGPGTGTAPLAITITPVPPVITSALVKAGIPGQLLSYTITATNNPTSFNAVGLPPGLAINAATGIISGTTVQGTTSVTISATNAGGTASATLLIQVQIPGAPVISSPLTATGQVGTVLVPYQIAATNPPLTSFNAVVNDGSPKGQPLSTIGLAVNTVNGLISGTPTTAGPLKVKVSATNAVSTGTADVVFTIAPLPPPKINSALTANGAVNILLVPYQITATNGPTIFTAAPLPPGLVLSVTGLITGTPTTAGTTAVVITAANATGMDTATVTFTIVPPPPAPVITSATLASGGINSPFTYQITASNTPTSFNAVINNGSPNGAPLTTAGLAINTTTGVISGTPTVQQVLTLTISATNLGGTGSATLTLSIGGPLPVITSPGTANAVATVPFPYTITATNSPTTFGSVVDDGTPAGKPLSTVGLSINTATGVFGGAFNAPGVVKLKISAGNASGTITVPLVVTVAPPPPTITSTLVLFASIGQPITPYQIVATNNATSFGAVVQDGSPNGAPLSSIGLSIDPNTGIITGAPIVDGTVNVLLSAINTSGPGTAVLVLNIAPAAPIITSTLQATGSLNIPFTYAITATGSQPTSYGAQQLPPGLTLTNNIISGTPNTVGIFFVILSATNALGTDTKTLVLTIGLQDSDGDGFPDELEVALGSNPNDPNSTPFNGKPAGVPALLQANVTVKVNFAQNGSDTITITGTLPASTTPGATVLNARVAVDVGSVADVFTLNKSGVGKNGGDSIKIGPKATKAGVFKFTARLKGNFAAKLATQGIKDETVKKVPRNVIAILLVTPGPLYADGKIFETVKTLTFTSKAGKSGSGK